MKRGLLSLFLLFFALFTYGQTFSNPTCTNSSGVASGCASACSAFCGNQANGNCTRWTQDSEIIIPANTDALITVSVFECGGSAGSGFGWDGGDGVTIKEGITTLTSAFGNDGGDAISNFCISALGVPRTITIEFTANRRDEAADLTVQTAPNGGVAGAGCTALLPVELTYFNVGKENKFNKLAWATATETNNAYFSIEYSRNGQGFKEIGQVEGAINSLEEIEYSFIHEEPNVGENYYRLRQVDLDGTFEYSNVVVVNRGGDNNISIRPNQVTSVVNVFFNEGYKKDTRGVIYDLLGSEVMNINLPANTTQHNIDVKDLPSGHYFFRIEEDRNIEVLRFVKMD